MKKEWPESLALAPSPPAISIELFYLLALAEKAEKESIRLKRTWGHSQSCRKKREQTLPSSTWCPLSSVSRRGSVLPQLPGQCSGDGCLKDEVTGLGGSSHTTGPGLPQP